MSWSSGLWRHVHNRHNGLRNRSTDTCFAVPGAYAAGLIDESQRFDITRNACPGAGACGGMYTANTMASAIDALGMSLPYSSSVPAEDPMKKVECRLAGRQVHSVTVTVVSTVTVTVAITNAVTVTIQVPGSDLLLQLEAWGHRRTQQSGL